MNTAARVSSTAAASVASAVATLGCLALSRSASCAGAAGDQQRGDDPGAGQRRREQRQQEIALAARRCRSRARRRTRPSASASTAVLRKLRLNCALGDQLRRHPEAVQDQRLRPPCLPRCRRGAAGRLPAVPRRRAGPSAAPGRRGRARSAGRRSRSRRRRSRPRTGPRSRAAARIHSQEACSRAVQRLLERRDQLEHHVGDQRASPTSSSARRCR